jgi:hypothetical protein
LSPFWESNSFISAVRQAWLQWKQDPQKKIPADILKVCVRRLSAAGDPREWKLSKISYKSYAPYPQNFRTDDGRSMTKRRVIFDIETPSHEEPTSVRFSRANTGPVTPENGREKVR